MQLNFPKLALIAGRGDLPRRILQQCKAVNRDTVVVAFHGQTDVDLTNGFDHFWTHLGAVGHTLNELKKRQVQEVVIAGAIRRPSWSELNLDWVGTKFLMRAGIKSLGDDGLLSVVIKLLEEEGFYIVTPDCFIENLMAPQGILTTRSPEDEDYKDINYGLAILKALAPLDVGQAVVIQRQIVLGVEAIEGTTQLLERCKTLKRSGPGGVLVKMAKAGQSLKVDLPTIGPETIQQAIEAGLIGIAVETGTTQILNQEQTIQQANEAGLFLVGVNSETL